MKQHSINDVIQGMIPYLDNAQAEKLQEVLQHTLFNYKKGPADIILDREKGRDYVHKGAKGKGTCNV